ncbi:hypothetical protein OJAV_G00124590 [Oryzias javanicus]|uniref:Roc domain-containing protein n=1 Tax=Oryzias javanicus TaxID=123683 RepID=A0A437CTL3_ORYJA|nr:hypothetical protein OJAV_G00124590 [Oryzias javanicus]
MRTLDENREEEEEQQEKRRRSERLKAARLWRDAALRCRKLRGGLRALTLCSKNDRLELPEDICEVEALNLANNSLQELPEELAASLGKLRVLELRRNRFTAAPRALLQLEQLLELDMSHNCLRTLAEGLFRLTALRKLCVSHNRIQALPPQIGSLQNLEELDVSFNLLLGLPGTFCGLGRLRALDADHNQLGHFPPEILALGRLEELDLSGNRFGALPASMWRPGSVKVLWLSSLQVSALPDGLCRLRQLESLMLDGNRLSALPPSFGLLQRLKMVNLSSNRLQDFPPALLAIAGLEELYLSRNALSRVPEELGRLRRLVNLWLDHNRIRRLPDSIVELQNLEELVLQGNQIAVLPDHFGRLSRVNIWKVKDNPLIQPPYEVCMKGIPHIALYQQELAQAQPALKPRLKLVLMGRRDAGKTRLRRSLMGTGEEEEGGGPGVELVHWEADAHRQLTFMVFDLSGKAGFDPVRPFFLSPGALYLLVVDLKAYQPHSFHDHVGRFLRLLGAKVPHAVVFVVGTHADLCGEAELEEKTLDIHRQIGLQEAADVRELRRRAEEVELALGRGFPARSSSPHVPFYGVSDRNLRRRRAQLDFLLKRRPQVLSPVLSVGCGGAQRNVGRLRDRLLAVAEHRHIFPNLQRVLPRSWQLLEELLLRSSELWLSRPSCARLGLQAGLTEDRLHGALSYLHESGTLLYFEDSPALKEHVFHNLPRLLGILNVLFQRERAALLDRLLGEGERGDKGRAGPLVEDEKGAVLTVAHLERHLDAFLRRGLLPSRVARLLLRPLVQTQPDLQLIMELLQKMGLCYRVGPPPDAAAADAWFRFPGYVGGEELQPGAPPAGPLFSMEQLHVQYSFPVLFPPGLLARFSVQIDGHVVQRADSRSQIVAYRGKVPVVVSHRPARAGREAETLSVISHASLPNIWTAWQAVTPLLEELDALLREWPGLLYSVHILCSKCLRRGAPSPHAFPGDLLTQPRPDGLTEIVCPENVSERVDVSLVYPPTPAASSPK